jgi:polyhydroxyalkanoate synthesis regulator phasin
VTKLTQEQAKKFVVDRTDCGEQEATKVMESLMVGDENLSANQAKELADELTALAKQQSEALQNAAYIKMSEKEAQQYDKRAVRISELCGLLGTFRPDLGKKADRTEPKLHK